MLSGATRRRACQVTVTCESIIRPRTDRGGRNYIMPITNLFSRRGKVPPEVYSYDKLPQALRVQVVHILQDTLGPYLTAFGGWGGIAKLIAKEHGILELPGLQRDLYGAADHYTAVLNYLLTTTHAKALDVIELCFRVVDLGRNENSYIVHGDPDEAIAELNARFKEHGCGFQFEARQIVRIDSQFLHTQTVVPTLVLLAERGFEGPNTEFLSAHDHFRHGRTEEAIVDACKAFESTMKAICSARSWRHEPTASARQLIQLIVNEGLVPTSSTEQLENVSKCLLGIATIRNKNAGHGAGAQPRDVPKHFAAYAIHLAASNMVFLLESHRSLRK